MNNNAPPEMLLYGQQGKQGLKRKPKKVVQNNKERMATHMQTITDRMEALPNILCRAANGDYYLLSMREMHSHAAAWNSQNGNRKSSLEPLQHPHPPGGGDHHHPGPSSHSNMMAGGTVPHQHGKSRLKAMVANSKPSQPKSILKVNIPQHAHMSPRREGEVPEPTSQSAYGLKGFTLQEDQIAGSPTPTATNKVTFASIVSPLNQVTNHKDQARDPEEMAEARRVIQAAKKAAMERQERLEAQRLQREAEEAEEQARLAQEEADHLAEMEIEMQSEAGEGGESSPGRGAAGSSRGNKFSTHSVKSFKSTKSLRNSSMPQQQRQGTGVSAGGSRAEGDLASRQRTRNEEYSRIGTGYSMSVLSYEFGYGEYEDDDDGPMDNQHRFKNWEEATNKKRFHNLTPEGEQSSSNQDMDTVPGTEEDSPMNPDKVMQRLFSGSGPLRDSQHEESSLLPEEELEDGVYEDKYAEACLEVGIPQSSTVVKELAKESANLDHLQLKLLGSQALAKALPYVMVVQSLSLRSNNLRVASVQALAAGLAPNRTVKHLDISKNPIGGKGAQLIGELLSVKNKPRQILESISMCSCGIDDFGVGALAFCLSLGNNTLKSLLLQGNKIGDAGAEQLADLLMQSRLRLEVLDLGWNCIGSLGGMAMANSLTENCRLVKLCLNWNGLETDGGMHICSALQNNHNLTELDLSYTRAGPEVCLVVCEALTHNEALSTLRLDGNPLGADGGRHLMWGLHTCHSLTSLSMKASVFAEDGPVRQMAGYAALNMQHPDNHYCLDVTEPPQSAVVRKLLTHHRQSNGFTAISNVKINGKTAPFDELDKMVESMPDEGIVEFTFKTLPGADGTPLIIASDKEVRAVLLEFSDVKVTNDMRSELLNVISSTYFFTSAQACEVLKTYDVGARQAEAAVLVFMRSIDTENFTQVLAVLNDQCKAVVLQLLGELGLFRVKNPTGHFRLDLSKSADRMLVSTLKEIALSEKDVDHMFNIEYSGRLTHSCKATPPDWHGTIPSSGTVTFDFVSYKRTNPAQRTFAPVRLREFSALKEGLFKHDLSGCLRNRENITTLRELSVRMYVSPPQLIELLQGLSSSAARVELVVSYASRLVPNHKLWRVLYALETWEQANVFYRLGPGICLNWHHPSMHYVFHCHNPHHKEMLKAFVTRAVDAADTQCIHNLRIDGKVSKVREDRNMYNFIFSYSPTLIEFDFLGADWYDLVISNRENDKAKEEGQEQKQMDKTEIDNRLKQYASRMEFSRMRQMQMAVQAHKEKEESESRLNSRDSQKRARVSGAKAETKDKDPLREKKSVVTFSTTGSRAQAMAAAESSDSDSDEENNTTQDPVKPKAVKKAAIKDTAKRKSSTDTEFADQLMRMGNGSDRAWEVQWERWTKPLVDAELAEKKPPVLELLQEIKDSAGTTGLLMPSLEQVGVALKAHLGAMTLPTLVNLSRLLGSAPEHLQNMHGPFATPVSQNNSRGQDRTGSAGLAASMLQAAVGGAARVAAGGSVSPSSSPRAIKKMPEDFSRAGPSENSTPSGPSRWMGAQSSSKTLNRGGSSLAVAAGLNKDRAITMSELTHLLVYCAPLGSLSNNKYSAPVIAPIPPLPSSNSSQEKLGQHLMKAMAPAAANHPRSDLVSKLLAKTKQGDK